MEDEETVSGIVRRKVCYEKLPGEQKFTWDITEDMRTLFGFHELIYFLRKWSTSDGCYLGKKKLCSTTDYPLVQVDILHEGKPLNLLISRSTLYILAFRGLLTGWCLLHDIEVDEIKGFLKLECSTQYKPNGTQFDKLGPKILLSAFAKIQQTDNGETAAKHIPFFMVHISEAARFHLVEREVERTLIPSTEKKHTHEGIIACSEPETIDLTLEVCAPEKLRYFIRNHWLFSRVWVFYALTGNQDHVFIRNNVINHCGFSKDVIKLIKELESAIAVLSNFSIRNLLKKCRETLVVQKKKKVPEYPWMTLPILEDLEKKLDEKRIERGATDTKAMKNLARYSRQELEVAYEDFSNIIGSSPDSLVYKGTLKGGPEIAVISLCIKEENWTGYLELYFQQEVADLSRLNHENTGKLLGYCRESSPFTRMLVFEYASNGTLYEHLHYGEGCQFSWTRRMKIIIGIARGLKYLHTELEPPFTILELNSSSVYLTEDFSPKLVDFECWKTFLSRLEKSSGAISNEGAVCILPSSMEGRHLDVQGNIYAFGILLLEVVSGRPPYCKDKGSLVDWAKEFLESSDAMSSVVDPVLKHIRQEDLKVVYEVVKLCIHPSSSTRTSMRDLCLMLESGIDTSISAEFNASSLAWAELALSS